MFFFSLLQCRGKFLPPRNHWVSKRPVTPRRPKLWMSRTDPEAQRLLGNMALSELLEVASWELFPGHSPGVYWGFCFGMSFCIRHVSTKKWWPKILKFWACDSKQRPSNRMKIVLPSIELEDGRVFWASIETYWHLYTFLWFRSNSKWRKVSRPFSTPTYLGGDFSDSRSTWNGTWCTSTLLVSLSHAGKVKHK